jgi:hypothetical protein
LLARSFFAKTAHLNLSVSGREGSARQHTHRSLGGSHLFEVGAGNEVWNIVVVGFSLGLLEQTLDLLVLLGSYLLEDLRDHVLELLRLWGTSGDQELLTHRELDYTEGKFRRRRAKRLAKKRDLLLGFLM